MLSPNISEDYPHYIKRCTHHFNDIKMRMKRDGLGDFPFLLDVDREVEKLFQKYEVLIENHLDEVYLRISNFIERTGATNNWEYLIDPKDLEQILQSAYQELGYAIHEVYHNRYAPEDLPKENNDLFNIFMATALLSRLSNLDNGGFSNRTISIALTAISTNKPVDEILTSLRSINSSGRASVIARTELGTAQSIAEAETMRRINDVQPMRKYWVGVLDDKIRDGHLGAAQFYNKLNSLEMSAWFNVNGELMQYPRHSVASPSNTVNCRCYLGYTKK